MTIIIDLKSVEMMRDALREKGSKRILTTEEYDLILYLNDRIDKEKTDAGN